MSNDINDVMDDPIESGLTPPQIALSAYRAFRLASEEKPPKWEDRDDIFRDAWLQMVFNLDDLFQRMENRTWAELIREVRVMNLRDADVIAMEAAVKMAWLLYSTESRYDSSPDALAEEEAKWEEWAANKRSTP